MAQERNQSISSSDNTGNFLERYSAIFLAAILLLALIIRLLALQSFNSSIYSDFLIWDERTYHTWALEILNGDHGTFSIHDFAPLPAYMMALIYKLFSTDFIYIRILNILLGLLTCFLIFLIGKEIADRTVGLISCLVASLYKPFIFFSITLQKTALSVFLFALAIYLFLVAWKSLSMPKLGFLGFVLGLILNVRPESGFLIPFMGITLLIISIKERKSAKSVCFNLIFYAIGLSLSISPFAIRNYGLTGDIWPSSKGGFNLYIANNIENPYPYYRPVPFATSVPSRQAIHFIIEASRREGKILSPEEASSFWIRETIRQARNQPVAFAKKIGLKMLAFLNQFEAADNYHIGFLSNFVTFLNLPFIGLWLVFPFGLAGLLWESRRTRKSTFLFIIMGLYGVVFIIFFTNVRYRLPLLVILIPHAVIGLNHLVRQAMGKNIKEIIIFSFVTAAFFTIEFLPIPGSKDMSAHYNTHAIVLSSKGRGEEAIRYWENSSQMGKPYSAYANLSLAGSYLNKGDYEKCRYYLDKIPDESFAAAPKYNLLGDLMMRDERKTKRALDAYRRSIEINSGQIYPRKKLVDIYSRLNREKAEKEKRQLDYISSFYKDAGRS